MSGFSGYVPLTFTEIKAYMELNKVDLLPSEIMILRKMSTSYVAQTHDKNPMAYAPFIDMEKLGKYDNSESIKRAFSKF